MRKCSVSERTTGFGHRVAHCNKKTKRTFRVNMISKRVWVPELNRFVRVKLSARGRKLLTRTVLHTFLKLALSKDKSWLVNQKVLLKLSCAQPIQLHATSIQQKKARKIKKS